MGLSSITRPFGRLSWSFGQIDHTLLTRPPLYSEAEAPFPVRLACINHAASVRSEPGSNPSIKEKFDAMSIGEANPRQTGIVIQTSARRVAGQTPVAESQPGNPDRDSTHESTSKLPIVFSKNARPR